MNDPDTRVRRRATVGEAGADSSQAPRAVRQALRAEYAGLAAAYDHRWARYVARSTAVTLQRLALQPHESLLDVGCGTGALLEAVQRIPGGHAAGVDLSPEMLAVARARLAPGTRRSSIGRETRLVAADALALPFRDATFDVVVSNSALHFTPDPAAALAEWGRVLRPGGRIVVTDWCGDGATGWTGDVVSRVADRVRRRPHRPALGSRGFARILAAAGFAAIRIERYRITWRWALMTGTARWDT